MICKIKYEKDGNEIIPYGLRLIPETKDEKNLLDRINRVGLRYPAKYPNYTNDILTLEAERLPRGGIGGGYSVDYNGTFGYWANWEKEDDSPKLESIDIKESLKMKDRI